MNCINLRYCITFTLDSILGVFLTEGTRLHPLTSPRPSVYMSVCMKQLENRYTDCNECKISDSHYAPCSIIEIDGHLPTFQTCLLSLSAAVSTSIRLNILEDESFDSNNIYTKILLKSVYTFLFQLYIIITLCTLLLSHTHVLLSIFYHCSCDITYGPSHIQNRLLTPSNLFRLGLFCSIFKIVWG